MCLLLRSSFSLGVCQTAGATRNECRQAAKDVVQRVGSRGATGTMVASLCRRLTPSLLAPEHISELLSAAQRVSACPVTHNTIDIALLIPSTAS